MLKNKDDFIINASFAILLIVFSVIIYFQFDNDPACVRKNNEIFYVSHLQEEITYWNKTYTKNGLVSYINSKGNKVTTNQIDFIWVNDDTIKCEELFD